MAEKRRKRAARRMSKVETTAGNLPAPFTDTPQTDEKPDAIVAAPEAVNAEAAAQLNEEIVTEVEQPRIDDMIEERRFIMSANETTSTTEGTLAEAGQAVKSNVVGSLKEFKKSKLRRWLY